MSGFIISKPPYSPSLGWHQDGWYWNDAEAGYGPLPAQIFAMYYLTDTRVSNGCLRAIKGTHRQVHTMHSELGRAHSEEVRSQSDQAWQDSPEHSHCVNADNIQVKAGDMVIGDARVLHGAHSNESDERRTLITMWYLPIYDHCSADFKKGAATLHFHQCGELYNTWTVEEKHAIAHLVPDSMGMNDATADSLTNQYDHNLSFMVRTPGWVGTDERSRQTWVSLS